MVYWWIMTVSKLGSQQGGRGGSGRGRRGGGRGGGWRGGGQIFTEWRKLGGSHVRLWSRKTNCLCNPAWGCVWCCGVYIDVDKDLLNPNLLSQSWVSTDSQELVPWESPQPSPSHSFPSPTVFSFFFSSPKMPAASLHCSANRSLQRERKIKWI